MLKFFETMETEREELARLRKEHEDLSEILDSHVPQMLYYSAKVPGIELAGFSLAQNGSRGGDLAFPILFVSPEEDEKCSIEPETPNSKAVIHGLKRGPSRMGLFMADATGHRAVDGVMAAMVYHAGRVALGYELRAKDDVSSNLARALNDSFYSGTPSCLPVALLLARFELDTHDSNSMRGSYISAGNPHPSILRSGESKLERADMKKVNLTASLGLMHSSDDPDSYKPNKFKLNGGDIMLLYSDGLGDFGRASSKPYFPPASSDRPNWVEKVLVANRDKSAADIAHAFHNDILTYALNREDDISLFVAKHS